MVLDSLPADRAELSVDAESLLHALDPQNGINKRIDNTCRGNFDIDRPAEQPAAR